MERVKRRKLKFPCLFGGNEESPKERTIQCWSPGDAITEQGLFKFEVGKSTSKHVKPMKKLLAKGIANETSAKKQSPSILAKLVGRDGLFSARAILKQQRRLSDNFSKSTASLGGRRNENPSNHHSDTKSIIEQQHLKAVEASHVANEHYSLQSSAEISTHSIHHSHKSFRNNLENKEVSDSNIPPKRIIVLKPNTRNSKKVDDSSDDCRKSTESLCSVTSEGDSWKYKESPGEVIFSGRKCSDDIETVTEISSQTKEGFEGGYVNLFGYGSIGHFGDESLSLSRSVSASESEVITVPSRITFDRHDRLTHSLTDISEPSLIKEAKNRMSERWKMASMQEGVEMVSKGSTLREILCGGDGHGDGDFRSTSSVYHEADADEMPLVCIKSINQGRRMGLKGIFNHDRRSKRVRCNKRSQSQGSNTRSTEFGNYLPDIHSSQRSTRTYFENEGPAKHQPWISDIDNDVKNAASLADSVAGYENKMSLETKEKLKAKLATCMVGDANYSEVDEYSSSSQEPLTATSEGTVSVQLSGPESEHSGSLKKVDCCYQFSAMEVPPRDDISSTTDRLKRLDSELQELEKQIHMLKIMTNSTSNDLQLAPIRQSSVAPKESITRESSLFSHILQASDTSVTEPAFFTSPWPAIHHPTDPTLFHRLENHYSKGAPLPRPERLLLHDYIESTFIRTSKSMAAHSWVSPLKRERQLTLTKLGIEDQMRKVIEEIEKEDDEIFEAINYDKDPEWVQQTNEIDILGKVIADLIMNDLVLEVIKLITF
ncbi:hypothetical protein OSB04_013640 [Centaurea solstitialis]|uniref:DUF4378 domain-containing protein n=1 Tax=Centaurea solstitialis TaxID=347529 RepID=A0AA38WRE0_9ASTR|nr:hypothetical protein OSB04_013640 [Centaurea solstitialis]